MKENLLQIEHINIKELHPYQRNAKQHTQEQIQVLLEKRKSKSDTTSNVPDDRRTTTTYDRWQKSNRRKFDDWFFGKRR